MGEQGWVAQFYISRFEFWEFPNYVAYRTPYFFTSDWLNEFFDKRADESDDYRFVYIGPKGSWTPLHMDVFGSHSWSVNVCGRKRWLLFPPGAEEYLCDKRKHLIYDVTDVTLQSCGEYPDIEKLFNTSGPGIEVIQGPGEAIFVPSGWHHQVWNLEDTISVNHNWFNGSNINFIWKNLMQALKDVEAELTDCQDMTDWPQTCQLVLKAHHGMNVEEFCQLLLCIADRAEREVCTPLRNWHSALEIVNISEVLKSVCQEEVAENLGLKERLEQLVSKLEDIKKTIIFDGTKA